MVLLIGHGQWILGGSDDRPCTGNLCVRDALRVVRVEPDAFGLKNAPEIYQRLIDNALYGHFKVMMDQDPALVGDVFAEGDPDLDPKPSVLGRRSYIDDILVTATVVEPISKSMTEVLGGIRIPTGPHDQLSEGVLRRS